MNLTAYTLKTPYNLYYAPTNKTYTGYTNTWETSLLLVGPQAGMQIDIPLGSLVRISPFFVLSSLSGNGTFIENAGASGAIPYSADFDIASSTTVATGFDIFIAEVSIGAMAQQGKSRQQGGNSSYLQLSVGYTFSNRNKKEDKPENK